MPNKFKVGDTVRLVSIAGMFSVFYVPNDAVGIVGTVKEILPTPTWLRYRVDFKLYGCELLCASKNLELVERNGGLK